jgi:biopolymer transport protein ExbD
MKMGYDNQPRSSSGTVVAIVLLLIFMVLGGLFVAGVGGWFFLRSSRTEQALMVEREQAVRAEQVARAMAEKAARAAQAQADQARELAAELEKEVVDETVPGLQISIELDKDGQLKLNGEAIDLPALMDRLKAPAADEITSITANVRADNECPFEHVVSVISSCQDLGITRFRIRTLDEVTAEDSAENKEPATVIK